VGGLLPLLAYFFTSTPYEGLKLSASITIVCLFIFGYFKSKVTGQAPIKGALKVTLIGVLAAAAAFGVAKFFDGVM
jgi:VIT1/CCC1 family predicted Fe2+/Mn2+ transporter